VFKSCFPHVLRNVATSMSVFVCFCVSTHISGTSRSNFTDFYVHVASSCGSVLLWRSCDTLCTSGLVDNVMFSNKGRYGGVTAGICHINLDTC